MSTVLADPEPLTRASAVEAELNYLAPGEARPVNYTRRSIELRALLFWPAGHDTH
jgi:hypothetical protein